MLNENQKPIDDELTGSCSKCYENSRTYSIKSGVKSINGPARDFGSSTSLWKKVPKNFHKTDFCGDCNRVHSYDDHENHVKSEHGQRGILINTVTSRSVLPSFPAFVCGNRCLYFPWNFAY